MSEYNTMGPGIGLSLYSGLWALRGYKRIQVYGPADWTANRIRQELNKYGIELRAVKWEEDGRVYARTNQPILARNYMDQLLKHGEIKRQAGATSIVRGLQIGW